MAKFSPTERINPSKQVGIMKNLLSNPIVSTISNFATLRGDIFVSDEIPTYKISITCSVESPPKVKVINPSVKKNAPHRYLDNSLCLYYPANFSWKEKANVIIKQTIPWTAMWIYCYEYWLQTEKWIGDEFPHNKSDKKKIYHK